MKGSQRLARLATLKAANVARPPTATRTPLPWVLRRAAAYLAELDGDRELADEALDLAANVFHETTGRL